MAGIGIKPSALANPIAGADISAMLQPNFAALKPAPAPQAEAPPVPMADPNAQMPQEPQPSQAMPDADPFEAAWSSADSAQNAAPTAGVDPFEAAWNQPLEPKTMHLGAQAELSFASSPKEEQLVAEKMYGKGSTIEKVGKQIQITAPDGQKYLAAPDDLGGWLHADTIPGKLAGLSRLAMTTGLMVATDAAALASAPFTAGASVSGLLASGALAESGVNAFKDAAGISDAPAYSPGKLVDSASSGLINAVFGVGGDKIAHAILGKASARYASETVNGMILPAVEKNLTAMQASLDTAEQLTGKKIEPLSYMTTIADDNPAAILEANKYADTPQVKGYFNYIKQMMSDSADALFNKFSGGAYSKAAAGAEEALGARVAKATEDFYTGTGGKIGKGRDLAIELSEGMRAAAPSVRTAINDAARGLGLLNEGDQIIAINKKEINQLFTDTTERRLATLIMDLHEKMYNFNDALPMSELRRYYTEMGMKGGLANQAAGHPQASGIWGLRHALIDDFDAEMQNLVTPEKFKEIGSAVAEYAQAKDTMKVFRNVLRNDAVSAGAVADSIFNGSSLEKFNAVDSVLSRVDPSLMNDLKGQWFKNIVSKHTTEGKQGIVDQVTGRVIDGDIDWSSLRKDLSGLGVQKLDKIFGEGAGPKYLNMISGFARIAESDLTKLSEEERKGLIKSSMKLAAQASNSRGIYYGYKLIAGLLGKAIGISPTKGASEYILKNKLSNGIDVQALARELGSAERSTVEQMLNWYMTPKEINVSLPKVGPIASTPVASPSSMARRSGTALVNQSFDRVMNKR